jgi:ribonuclease P protein subunit POP4
MPYDNSNIVLHELVGLGVEVVDSLDRDQIGLRGRVVKETKNLLHVRVESNIKLIVKSISVFRFDSADGRFIVSGKEIAFRSHERTGKALRFYKRRKANAKAQIED